MVCTLQEKIICTVVSVILVILVLLVKAKVSYSVISVILAFNKDKKAFVQRKLNKGGFA